MQNEMVKYIAGILNIKIDTKLIVADMTEELSKVKNLANYRAFIRENLKSADVEYQTGFQKFIILTDKFLGIEEDQALSDTYDRGEAYAKAIAAKVKQVRSLVANENCRFSDIKLEGNMFFEMKELLSLAAVGSTQGVIELSKTHRLAGEIYKNEIGKIKKRMKPEQLAVKTQKLLEGLK